MNSSTQAATKPNTNNSKKSKAKGAAKNEQPPGSSEEIKIAFPTAKSVMELSNRQMNHTVL